MHLSLVLFMALHGSDDRDVIQASLLSFYKEEIWHSYDWKSKQPIHLLDTYAGDDGMSMELTLRKLQVSVASALDRLKRESETKRDADYVDYYASVSSELNRIIPLLKQKGDSVPLRCSDLRTATWDARIQLVETFTRGLGSQSVSARARRPRYSESGLHAWVSFSMPWSMHFADVEFVLEKSKETWRVLFGHATFYF